MLEMKFSRTISLMMGSSLVLLWFVILAVKLTGRDAFVALIMLIGAVLILAADFLVK